MLPWDLGALLQLIGYPGLAAIIFAESGIIVGFFLPGASLLFTAGFLASQGFLDIRIIVPLVAVAAVLGDNVGYWFGAKVGARLFDRPDSRFFKREYLERTRRFYAKYGTRTILMARFVPIVRTFAPILAGVAGMPYRPFMLYNLAGGILWAGGISYAGYLVGETIPETAEYIELVILGIIVLTTIPLIREFWRRKKAGPKLPAAVIFDLDDTLTESWRPMNAEMGERIAKLLERIPVAVMTATSRERAERQFMGALPAGTPRDRLFFVVENAAQAFSWRDDEWRKEYDVSLTETERRTVLKTLDEVVHDSRVIAGEKQHGIRIENRSAGISFAALGVDAPHDAKAAWDPRRKKRKKLVRELKKRLKGFEVYIGGRATIDITKKGVSKARGVRWLASRLGVDPKDMLFVGDSLLPGGNDAAVLETKIETVQVRHPEDTAAYIDKLLAIEG